MYMRTWHSGIILRDKSSTKQELWLRNNGIASTPVRRRSPAMLQRTRCRYYVRMTPFRVCYSYVVHVEE
eukprot:1401510-Pleurochrysis_carterae.AAC.1